MKSKNFFFMLSFISFTVACTTVNVVQVDKGSAVNPEVKNGFYYFLPKTECGFILSYKKTVVAPGDYYLPEGKCLLEDIPGVIEVIDAKKVSYSIDKVELTTIAVPDSLAQFYVESKLKDHPFLLKNYNFVLNGNGYLSEAGIKSTDYTADIALSVASGAVTVLGSLAGLPSSLPLKTFGIKAGAYAYMPETTGYDNIAESRLPALKKCVEEALKRKYTDKKMYDSMYQKALTMQLIVKKIIELRERREELVSGSALDKGYSNVPLDIMLKDFDRRETELRTLLAASKTEVVLKELYPYTPQTGSTVLSGFSTSRGILRSQKGEINPSSDTLFSLIVRLDLYNDIKSIQQHEVQKTATLSGAKGIYYRVPATVRIQFEDNKPVPKMYLQQQQVIGQLGAMAYLPARIGLTKNELAYTLDPNTGALLKFSGNSEGVNKEQVNSFVGTLSGLPKQLKDSTTLNTILSEQVQLLQSQVLIKQLQLQLDSLANVKN